MSNELQHKQTKPYAQSVKRLIRCQQEEDVKNIDVSMLSWSYPNLQTRCHTDPRWNRSQLMRSFTQLGRMSFVYK